MTIIMESQQRTTIRRRFKNTVKDVCSVKTLKKRLPILEWLPKYNLIFFMQDIIAGITVGLTAIPQGIAVAIIGGLPPEYGLYASLTSGIVYMIFGSCKAVTVGPTAILTSMIARYVSDYSAYFAILAAFLTGVIQLAMGICRLGFLVNFISKPVISGFITAGVLQISTSQLKSYFALTGPSGNTFVETVYNFALNIKTAKLWDPILATTTIVMLLLLQRLGKGCNRTDSVLKQIRWFISIARNVVVIVFGMILAYILKITIDSEPLELIGEIGRGLPGFGLPPFSTIIGNETYSFIDMVQILGPTSIVIPLLAVFESVFIAKSFCDGVPVDATQEMIAIGMCNMIGSFAKSIPITGSFMRTAFNYISGVQTQAGGITKVLVLFAALSFLTSTFYYIPKALLSGLIITSMFAMLDYSIIYRFWRDSKRDFFVFVITVVISAIFGLQYGVLAGIILDAAMLIYAVSRPKMEVRKVINDKGHCVVIPLTDTVAYCTAEYIRKLVIKTCDNSCSEVVIVIDGANVRRMDITVAVNLMLIVKDFDKKSRKILFENFDPRIKVMCINNDGNLEKHFVTNIPV